MNILYVPTKDPRLTNGGNEQRTNLLWESLKRYGNVYTFLLDRKLEKESERIDGQHPIYKYRLNVNKRSLWYIFNVFICRLAPFSIWRGKNIKQPNVARVFRNVSFDLVVTRYIYPLCYCNYWEIAPLLIDIDDHPFQVYNTVQKKRLPIGLKTIGKYITTWQTKYIVNKAKGGWIANKEQLNLCGNNFGFLPNIPQFPSIDYKVDYGERKNIFTVGAMGYGPNKEGVTYFLKQIWPLFHKRYPEVKYYIIGKGAKKDVADLWNSYEGVKYLGYVEDIEALYEKTLATVVPVYSGGGTCIKTLESIAYSRTCLSTRFGARGLSEDIVNEEKGILLFEDAESFINAYNKVLDTKRREENEKRGRDVVTSIYSIDSFNKAVDDIVSKLGYVIK